MGPAKYWNPLNPLYTQYSLANTDIQVYIKVEMHCP